MIGYIFKKHNRDHHHIVAVLRRRLQPPPVRVLGAVGNGLAIGLWGFFHDGVSILVFGEKNKTSRGGTEGVEKSDSISYRFSGGLSNYEQYGIHENIRRNT